MLFLLRVRETVALPERERVLVRDAELERVRDRDGERATAGCVMERVADGTRVPICERALLRLPVALDDGARVCRPVPLGVPLGVPLDVPLGAPLGEPLGEAGGISAGLPRRARQASTLPSKTKPR